MPTFWRTELTTIIGTKFSQIRYFLHLSQIELKGHNRSKHVRRPKGKAFDPKYTKKTTKFGGGSVMIWGCVSYYGVGRLVKVENTLKTKVNSCYFAC